MTQPMWNQVFCISLESRQDRAGEAFRWPEAKLQALPPGDPEREDVVPAIDRERQRFEAFHAYNARQSNGE